MTILNEEWLINLKRSADMAEIRRIQLMFNKRNNMEVSVNVDKELQDLKELYEKELTALSQSKDFSLEMIVPQLGRFVELFKKHKELSHKLSNLKEKMNPQEEECT